MNTNPQTPNLTPITDEQADRLFTAYFHAHRPATWRTAPQPWPTAVLPAQTTTPRDTMLKSRLTLAASVALLIGGCWYLSGYVTNGKKPTGLNITDDSTANHKNVKDLSKLPKNK